MPRRRTLSAELRGRPQWELVAQKSGPPPRPVSLYPFDIMEVGDHVLIKNRSINTVRQAIYNYRKRTGSTARFSCHLNGRSSCDVWKLSD